MPEERSTELLNIAADARRGATRLARRLRAERPVHALSANKIGVLSHLHRHGPSTPGDVAEAERQRPQSLTRVFAELELAELISRSPSPADRRESLLALTGAGFDALSQDMAERDIWLAEVIAGLSDTEARVLQIAGILMDRLADA